ncbi:MAG: TonB-dependent receptor [Sphingomonas phyllosphaerae]
MRSNLIVRVSALALIVAGAAADAAAQSVSPSSGHTEKKRVKDKKAKSAPQSQVDDDPNTIQVVGVRNSLSAARHEKRNAAQIVDVVKAEDVGKLPNNTVADVVSLIPGIQVTRDEGGIAPPSGNGIQLRGLGDIQTSVNGVPITNSLDRTGAFQQLPADLVKSVEVYKTRTADQPEGSGAGTINVTLRRPTDFRLGFSGTVIGQARYVQQAGKVNQNYTGILNYNADTSIGKVGVLLNVTYNANPFLESRALNDSATTLSPRQVVGSQLTPFPLIGPYQAAFTYVTGHRDTIAYSGAVQWKPEDNVSLVLEGSYTHVDWQRNTAQLYVPVLSSANNTAPALSNIKLVPGTNRLASVTVSPVTQFGPITSPYNNPNDSLVGQLSGVWDTPRFTLKTAISVSQSINTLQDRNIRNRFVNRPEFDIEFASDKFRYPMMNANFRNVDLLDPKQYRFAQFDESIRTNNNVTAAGQSDLTLRTFWDSLDWLQVGMRWEQKRYKRRVRARSFGNLLIPASDMPEGFQNLIPIAEGFRGTGVQNNARWLSYDFDTVTAAMPALYDFLWKKSADFQTPLPPLSQSDFFDGKEYTFSSYGQLHYAIKVLFPIDGVMGVRISNTDVQMRSFQRRRQPGVVNGANATVLNIAPIVGHGNYLSVLPSLNAIVHFADPVQLRLGYTQDFRRPSLFSMSSSIDVYDANEYASAGNPDLKPERSTKYDASLEFYFGKTGLITIAPFYWKLKGAITNFYIQEQLYADAGLYDVLRPYNAGKGYRRGFEVQGQTFFSFLPGIMKSFGVQANYTYTDSKLEWDKVPGAENDPPSSTPLTNTAKNVFNLVGLFERDGLNARLSYNWRGKILTGIQYPLYLSQYMLPVDWMDAAVNYEFKNGPFKGLILSGQVSNIMASTRRTFYGFPDQPREVIYQSRTYGGSVRYKF